MQVIVNHLTRMQPGYFCVAGIEPQSQLHVRPVLPGGLRTELLRREGGAIDWGTVLDLGRTQFVGRAPEIEDRSFEPEALQSLGDLDRDQLVNQCDAVAKESLAEVFGPELKRVGHTAALAANTGLVSLGCCWITLPQLRIASGDTRRLKLHWRDAGEPIAVAVADLRLYEPDHRTIRDDVVQRVQNWLEGQSRVLVSVGLSRLYRKSDDQQPMHWLQVNNIHYA